MLIYLCFIYFNGYSKIKICIKKTNLLGLFSLYLLFFQFYNKISNWFLAVLNRGKMRRIMKDDHLASGGRCHGAGTGAKRSSMTATQLKMQAWGQLEVRYAEGHDEECLQVQNIKNKTSGRTQNYNLRRVK